MEKDSSLIIHGNHIFLIYKITFLIIFKEKDSLKFHQIPHQSSNTSKNIALQRFYLFFPWIEHKLMDQFFIHCLYSKSNHLKYLHKPWNFFSFFFQVRTTTEKNVCLKYLCYTYNVLQTLIKLLKCKDEMITRMLSLKHYFSNNNKGGKVEWVE